MFSFFGLLSLGTWILRSIKVTVWIESSLLCQVALCDMEACFSIHLAMATCVVPRVEGYIPLTVTVFHIGRTSTHKALSLSHRRMWESRPKPGCKASRPTALFYYPQGAATEQKGYHPETQLAFGPVLLSSLTLRKKKGGTCFPTKQFAPRALSSHNIIFKTMKK